MFLLAEQLVAQDKAWRREHSHTKLPSQERTAVAARGRNKHDGGGDRDDS